jgi:hypothetical protein
MRFEVLTNVKMTMFIWVIKPCVFVDKYRRFGEAYSVRPYFSLKDGDSMFLRKSVSTYESTWRYKPEEQHQYGAFHYNTFSRPCSQTRSNRVFPSVRDIVSYTYKTTSKTVLYFILHAFSQEEKTKDSQHNGSNHSPNLIFS